MKTVKEWLKWRKRLQFAPENTSLGVIESAYRLSDGETFFRGQVVMVKKMAGFIIKFHQDCINIDVDVKTGEIITTPIDNVENLLIKIQ